VSVVAVHLFNINNQKRALLKGVYNEIFCIWQVIFDNTVNTYDSEPLWNNCRDFQRGFRMFASGWMPSNQIFDVGNDSVHIQGSYVHPVLIKDFSINETGTLFWVLFGCLSCLSCITKCKHRLCTSIIAGRCGPPLAYGSLYRSEQWDIDQHNSSELPLLLTWMGGVLQLVKQQSEQSIAQ